MSENEDDKRPAEDAEFRASDLREAAGLSYRQVHTWDSKGALPNQREGAAGWRKFTGREVFAIMVCSEIRRRFGAPVESLRFVRSFMLQEKADHLRFAMEQMAMGMSVWLLTDLHETFIMDTDLEFDDLFRHGFFRGDHPQGFVLLNVNSIVNRMLESKGLPIRPISLDGVYAHVASVRSALQVRNSEEWQVLQSLRQRTFRRVTVEMKDGDVVHVSTEEEHATGGREVTEEQVIDLLKEQEYQTITVTKHDGRIVRLNQTVPTPLKTTGEAPARQRPPARQKDPERGEQKGRRGTKQT